MSAEENNKNEMIEVVSDKKDLSFVKGETFAEYIMRRHGLQKEDSEDKVLERVCEATALSDFMEHLKWKNEEPSIIGRSHLIAPMLTKVWLHKTTETYTYAVRNAEKDEKLLKFERQEAVWLRTREELGHAPDGFSQLAFFNNSFIPQAINDLESQILNGSGEKYNLTGLLKQGKDEKPKGDLKKVCMSAIETFCEQTGGWPSVLVMTFRQRLRLMQVLSEKMPEILTMTRNAPFDCFAGVPIVLSDFMPQDNMMLANLNDVFLILKERGDLLQAVGSGSRREMQCDFLCNVKVREPSSVMRIILPKAA